MGVGGTPVGGGRVGKLVAGGDGDGFSVGRTVGSDVAGLTNPEIMVRRAKKPPRKARNHPPTGFRSRDLASPLLPEHPRSPSSRMPMPTIPAETSSMGIRIGVVNVILPSARCVSFWYRGPQTSIAYTLQKSTAYFAQQAKYA
jgi:hypothetical protein